MLLLLVGGILVSVDGKGSRTETKSQSLVITAIAARQRNQARDFKS